MLPYHTERASSSLPVRSTPPAGGPRFRPAHRLDRDQAPLDFDDPAEDETRVHGEPHRLLERGGGEVEIQETIGLAAMPVGVPVASVVEIETA
jgi:hypothetical protein